ncbi:hypothetical protein E2C01_043407 [Portunus trituberculatus]|uniref:Uncharacterized protein n=1 Tax=Portunus trituberculatus TaxID=210409 RepID=A0A5B7FWM3_PORTR|nr:hypothetical protein [Portunus trituberculatus]
MSDILFYTYTYMYTEKWRETGIQTEWLMSGTG